jgi:cytochrome c-type biogenesis protein CcmE
MVYYYTVPELQAKGAVNNVRVAGDLVNGTVTTGGVGDALHFKIITKGRPDIQLAVTYTGTVPDTFKDDPANPVEVVLEGDYLADGTFAGRTMLAKCPSRYKRATPGAQPTTAN